MPSAHTQLLKAAKDNGWETTTASYYMASFRRDGQYVSAQFSTTGAVVQLDMKQSADSDLLNITGSGKREAALAQLNSEPPQCDGGCGVATPHSPHVYSVMSVPDEPARPDAFQVRMFNSQWDRRIAAVGDALRRLQVEVEHGQKMLERSDLPNSSLTEFVSRYSRELEALEALREFGKVMGIER